MKKAKILEEMYDSFEGIKPLTEDEYEEFYVPIYTSYKRVKLLNNKNLYN